MRDTATNATTLSGPDLRELRHRALVSEDLMSRSLGLTIRGLRSFEGRTRLPVVFVSRYLKALVVAQYQPDAIPAVEVVAQRPEPKIDEFPSSDVMENLIKDIAALPWVPGECFDAGDVTRLLNADWNPQAIEFALNEMTKRGHIRATTYWGGVRGFSMNYESIRA